MEATLVDADLNAVLAAAAVQDAYQAQSAQAEPTQAPIPDEAGKSFEELVDAVSDPNAVRGCHNMVANLQDRALYERQKNGYNDNIQRTISKAILQFNNIFISRAMIASGTDENLFNSSEVSGARRNVLAFEKIIDILRMSTRGWGKNPTNIAIICSMVRCAERQLDFTGDIAKACASDKFPLPHHYQPFVRRHTAAESTGRSQFSSTMSALEALGVAKQVGTQRAQKWVWTNTPLAKRLEEVVRAKHLPMNQPV